jgi:hypothetical protein
MQLFFFPRLLAAVRGNVCMLIKGYIKQLCGATSIYLRLGVPEPTTNFVGTSVTLTKTQHKAALNAPYQFGQKDARKLEDWLEMQPQRFLMFGINPDTYNAVVWVASQFSGALNSLWLNCKIQLAILDKFDFFVT